MLYASEKSKWVKMFYVIGGKSYMLFSALQKIIDKVSSSFRKKVFKERVKSCGEDLAIYGKIYLINTNVIVGSNVKIYPGVQFFGNGPILIGNNVSIGNNVMIYSSEGEGIVIGDDTNIAAQCYIVDMNHGMKIGTLIRKQDNIAKKIVIENDVWIGANATILKGVEIKKGAVVGAKSLVNKNVDENTIVAGIPARIIGDRKG